MPARRLHEVMEREGGCFHNFGCLCAAVVAFELAWAAVLVQGGGSVEDVLLRGNRTMPHAFKVLVGYVAGNHLLFALHVVADVRSASAGMGTMLKWVGNKWGGGERSEGFDTFRARDHGMTWRAALGSFTLLFSTSTGLPLTTADDGSVRTTVLAAMDPRRCPIAPSSASFSTSTASPTCWCTGACADSTPAG